MHTAADPVRAGLQLMESKGDAAPLFQHIDVHESNKVPGPSAHLKLATPLQVKLAGSNLKVRLPCDPPTQAAQYAGPVQAGLSGSTQGLGAMLACAGVGAVCHAGCAPAG